MGRAVYSLLAALHFLLHSKKLQMVNLTFYAKKDIIMTTLRFLTPVHEHNFTYLPETKDLFNYAMFGTTTPTINEGFRYKQYLDLDKKIDNVVSAYMLAEHNEVASLADIRKGLSTHYQQPTAKERTLQLLQDILKY